MAFWFPNKYNFPSFHGARFSEDANISEPIFIIHPKFFEGCGEAVWDASRNDTDAENPFCICSLPHSEDTCACCCHISNFLDTMRLQASHPGSVKEVKQLASRILHWLTHIPLQEDLWTQVYSAQLLWSNFENRLHVSKITKSNITAQKPEFTILHSICNRQKTRYKLLQFDDIVQEIPRLIPFEEWMPTAKLCLTSEARNFQELLPFKGIRYNKAAIWSKESSTEYQTISIHNPHLEGKVFIDFDVLPNSLQTLQISQIKEWRFIGYFAIDIPALLYDKVIDTGDDFYDVEVFNSSKSASNYCVRVYLQFDENNRLNSVQLMYLFTLIRKMTQICCH